MSPPNPEIREQARDAYNRGEYSEALRLFQEYFSERPSDPKTFADAEGLFDFGMTLLQFKSYAQAIPCFEMASSKRALKAKSHYYLGFIYHCQANYPRALEHLCQFINDDCLSPSWQANFEDTLDNIANIIRDRNKVLEFPESTLGIYITFLERLLTFERMGKVALLELTIFHHLPTVRAMLMAQIFSSINNSEVQAKMDLLAKMCIFSLKVAASYPSLDVNFLAPVQILLGRFPHSALKDELARETDAFRLKRLGLWAHLPPNPRALQSSDTPAPTLVPQ